jgi:long-chain fatty acid transport protein
MKLNQSPASRGRTFHRPSDRSTDRRCHIYLAEGDFIWFFSGNMLPTNTPSYGKKRTTAVFYGIAAGSLLAPSVVHGEGFRNPPPGGFSLARAGGRIAQIEDASAVWHNPANIVEIPSIEIEATATIVHLEVDHNNFSGMKAETRDPWKLLPNAFVTTPILADKISAGLGVVTPFGLGNEWKKEGAFGPGGVLRYSAPYFTELITVDFNPTVAFKITDSLLFGAGLDVYWSQLTFKQIYPWGAIVPGAGDGDFRARGDGTGIGGNFGLTWKITDKQRAALTYRSPFNVDYDGNLDINNQPVPIPGVTDSSHFATKVKYPTIVSAGYGIELTDNVRLETDVEWLQFSRFDKLELDLGNNSILFPSTTYNQNWHNTFTAGIAADWRFCQNWSLRGGYQFYETPVPDYTFSTTIPDSDQHAVTVGLNYKYKHHSLDLSYGWIVYLDRNITANQNPVFIGSYEMAVHLIDLGYHYSF